jgi:hypothetical protein
MAIESYLQGPLPRWPVDADPEKLAMSNDDPLVADNLGG